MTDDAGGQDARFHEAVAAIDAGDIAALESLIDAHPSLVTERLEFGGAWLRNTVGDALDGFFQRPYLLWFVAEDPVRNGKLPSNIATIARTIIDRARRHGATNLQEQVDYALSLVSWSWIARECGVQLELIDVLADAGAVLDGNPNNALVNSNVAAAEHLVSRGAPLTLATAVCIGRFDDAKCLLANTDAEEKQFAFVLAALNGKTDALRLMLHAIADINAPSARLYSHGTPLHHAVSSGVLDAVRVLVDAGADLNRVDTAWEGTPLGWALHYVEEGTTGDDGRQYSEIAAYLRRVR